MFGTILISVCTVMHVYVFWRAASVPFVDRHVSRKVLIGTGVVLWALFFFGRVMGHGGTGDLAGIIEFLGMNWMGVLFLTFIPLFSMDLVTLFGFLMSRLSPSFRGWALLAGGRKIRSGPSRPCLILYKTGEPKFGAILYNSEPSFIAEALERSAIEAALTDESLK